LLEELVVLQVIPPIQERTEITAVPVICPVGVRVIALCNKQQVIREAVKEAVLVNKFSLAPVEQV
jgi:hypothetical protein